MTAVIIVSSSTKRSVVHISRGAIRGYFLLSPVLDSDDWVHLPLMKLDLRDCGRLTIDMTGSNDDSVYRDSSGTPQAFERGRSRSSFFFWSFTPPPPFPHPKKREAHIGRNMISFRAPEPEEVAEDLSVAISSCQ